MRRSLRRLYVEYVPQGSVDAAPAASLLTQPEASIHQGTLRFRRTENAAAKADAAVASQGFFSLPKLKYPVASGVAPVLSAKQFRYIYDVVHRDNVEKLNRFALGSDVEGHTLETVIRQTSFDASLNAIHTPAAEHFNYCFFYQSLRPWGTALPAQFREAITLQYGNNEHPAALLQSCFIQAASTLQSRSGWVYLVWTGSKLDVLALEHGTTPLAQDVTPLLGMSVHESSYFLDYPVVGYSGLEAYVRNFFKGCNWALASRYFTEASSGKLLDRTF